MNKKKLRRALTSGSIASFISMALTLFLSFNGGTSHVMHLTYGGDAYTGIQNAGASTANNVFALYLLIGIAIACFFAILGITLFMLSRAVDVRAIAAPEKSRPNLFKKANVSSTNLPVDSTNSSEFGGAVDSPVESAPANDPVETAQKPASAPVAPASEQ